MSSSSMLSVILGRLLSCPHTVDWSHSPTELVEEEDPGPGGGEGTDSWGEVKP